MREIDKKYVLENRDEIIRAILDGKIFIYPTDTIYGIGANAENTESVKIIRAMKEREIKPFSVIAPSIEWIRSNFIMNQNVESWLSKLPDALTLFLDRKNMGCVSEEVNPADDTLGVRIPKHWFTEVIASAGVPFVTTSVNKSGRPYMTKIEDVGCEMSNYVDYIIYEGEKTNKESEKVDLRKN